MVIPVFVLIWIFVYNGVCIFHTLYWVIYVLKVLDQRRGKIISGNFRYYLVSLAKPFKEREQAHIQIQQALAKDKDMG